MKVFDPAGNLVRMDVLPLNGPWTLAYYGDGPGRTLVISRIELEPTPDDADPGCWEFNGE